MRKPDTLSNLLPYSFTNGTVISRFAKRCPNCKNTVESSEMLGQFIMLNNMLFVTAIAECNVCKHSFRIACTINNKRKIKESIMPGYMFDACLSKFMQRFRVLPSKDNPQVSTQNTVLLEKIPSLSFEEVTEAELLIGLYDGINIPAWIEHNGQKMDFVRVIPCNMPAQLQKEELLYRQHLVFSSMGH